MNKAARPVWLPEVRDAIGLLVIGALVGMLFILLLRPVTVPDNQMTNILIGGFMTASTAVIQFYFGSSKSSLAKDDTINSMAVASAEAVPAAPVAKDGTATTTTVTVPSTEAKAPGAKWPVAAQ